jgi:1-deoxy-D-xylulose-5-phosphate synthase
VHDVAIQKLHVVFAMDRAGLVGADGPTHHGTFDLSYLRLIPGIIIMAPKDESELRDMLYTAVQYKDGPIALRYPRGSAIGVKLKENFEELPIGKGEILKEGNDAILLAVGNMVQYAYKSAEILDAEGINCSVVNMRFIKPMDNALLDYAASKFNRIITLEENSSVGGFGSGILEYFNEKNYKNNILNIALPDKFIEHGTQKELHKILEIDSDGIVKKIKSFFQQTEHQHKVTS